MMFRLLKSDEIECRVAQINEKGLSLLLYKNARTDQDILDETVGAMNWQRAHTRDNANCIVSIWDKEKQLWISKEDTGTESNTEKEKGLASDSFKRACFNWGIGRELYSAPFIWISADKAKIEPTTGGKFKCKDSFYVSQIFYDDNRNISKLEINNSKTNRNVFSWEKEEKQEQEKEQKQEQNITPMASEKQISYIKLLGRESGENMEYIKSRVKKWETLTAQDASSIIKYLQGKGNK